MYKLMKLEWQKHKLYSVLFQVVYCIIGIYGFMLFISLTSRSDGDPLSSFNDFMALLTILSNITFIILGSVLLSRIIISEFRMKTIHVLFTYPISRKKLLITKLLLIYTVTACSLLFSIIFMEILTYFLQPSLQLFEGSLQLTEILTRLPMQISSALMMASIALIPLFFGMRKKSTATTITSATLIAFLINMTYSNAGESIELATMLFIPAILAFIGFAITYSVVRKMDIKDVIE